MKSARTLWNPNEYAGVGEKKPTGGLVGFDIWWWKRDPDSNPFSKAVGQVYVTCPCFWRLSFSYRGNIMPHSADISGYAKVFQHKNSKLIIIQVNADIKLESL